jgi:hypothetical protein
MENVQRIALIGNPAVLDQTPSSIQLAISKTSAAHNRRSPGMLPTGNDSLRASIRAPKLQRHQNKQNKRQPRLQYLHLQIVPKMPEDVTFVSREARDRRNSRRC